MQGFQETIGISYTSDNESSSCSEDVEASATLVSMLSSGTLVAISTRNMRAQKSLGGGKWLYILYVIINSNYKDVYG